MQYVGVGSLDLEVMPWHFVLGCEVKTLRILSNSFARGLMVHGDRIRAGPSLRVGAVGYRMNGEELNVEVVD